MTKLSTPKQASKFKLFILYPIFLGLSFGVLAVIGAILYLTPNLPNVEQIREIQLKLPLRVYTLDEKLIAEFGEERRSTLTFDEIPTRLVDAVLAAEDDRFFSHPGVDIKGLARASMELLQTGRIQTGGSTITMQVAKNYFLSRERTFIRKFNEILLAIALERRLSKEEIFELYANKIYLGHRAYGFAAAGKVYYGSTIPELNLAQLAMIAGLPKAPSRYNPITNPARAQQRRDWILQRMLTLGNIDHNSYEEARNSPVTAKFHGLQPEVEAGYAAEMVRQSMIERFGDRTYAEGYHVYTSIDSETQSQATFAVHKGLLDYSKRHGYFGPVKQFTELATAFEHTNEPLAQTTAWVDFLESEPEIGPLLPAVVLAVIAGEDAENTQGQASIGLKNASISTLEFSQLEWARRYESVNRLGPQIKQVADVLSVGDLIYVTKDADQNYILAQLPKVQGALVAMDPNTGSVKALVGGFDFQQSKFNRVIQGGRQAGSSFKPFIYGAALNHGLTAATLINDAPIVFDDQSLEQAWRPENSSGNFFGPTRLRKALYKSRNLVSIRVLQQVGIKNTVDYLTGFGFSEKTLPKNLSLALGSATITPLQLAVGYSSLANGGYKIKPYLIDRVLNGEGQLIYKHQPNVACAKHLLNSPEVKTQCLDPNRQAPRHMAEDEHFLLQDMLKDVIKRGTGRKALSLKRNDIAGKTGTTNDQRDAWFSGYHPHLVTTTWVGFDTPASLGVREYGSTAALPIWISFMGAALTDMPLVQIPQPENIVSVKIDAKTGLRATEDNINALFEFFRKDNAPEKLTQNRQAPVSTEAGTQTMESLF